MDHEYGSCYEAKSNQVIQRAFACRYVMCKPLLKS